MRTGAMAGLVLLGVSGSNDVPAALGDFELAQQPLYMKSSQPPLMMMVLSRDEQLFNKAYSDYTDIDDDGIVDGTYKDGYTYAGYFDSNLCYDYDGGSRVFRASAQVGGGKGRHVCSGKWSGNFLNWATMSRLDLLRSVLYGGMRSMDTDRRTILQRAHIPNDLHAWVKVYHDASGQFTPNGGIWSYCNLSDPRDPVGLPLMRVAQGSHTEWGSTEREQCIWKGRLPGGNSIGDTDRPASGAEYVVQVDVCGNPDPALRESFCRGYGEGNKPAGLLQQYGENGRLRFGLISGTYSNPRSGGMLRKNIGKFSGNGSTQCAPGDEVDLRTGQFCTGASASQGSIVKTIDNFKLTQWGETRGARHWLDCSVYGILNRSGKLVLNNPGPSNPAGGWSFQCSAWGNPVAEMYAEALRYIAGAGSATSGFNLADNTPQQSGLSTGIAWLDPYRDPAQGGNQYCAGCSILVLSSGLPSFDGDQIPQVPGLASAIDATDRLGRHEGISGGNYFAGRFMSSNSELDVGRNVDSHGDLCKSGTVGALSRIRGVCPESPSTEGSYLMAGLAHAAFTSDLRPGLQGKPSSHKNNVRTYTVAMADSVPTFQLPVGNGHITIAPLCQANNNSKAMPEDGGWRSCFLGSVGVGTKSNRDTGKVYGLPMSGDGKSGSYWLVWEDSLWGNDHDNDVVSMLSYCIGSACTPEVVSKLCGETDSDSRVCPSGRRIPTVPANSMLVRLENLSAYAGNSMLTGITVTGSTNDGTYREVYRLGNNDGTLLGGTRLPNGYDKAWSKARVFQFQRGSVRAGVLESPLWYAAKYGNFDDADRNLVPNDGEWDKNRKGVPDGYFLARNPTRLRDSLAEIFEAASESQEADTGLGGSGLRINAGSFTVGSSFSVSEKTNDWSGDLSAYAVQADGRRGSHLWRAAQKMPGWSSRNLWTALTPTRVTSSGAVLAPPQRKTFTTGELGNTEQEVLAALGLSAKPTWMEGDGATALVDYLRGSPAREKTHGGPFRNRTRLPGAGAPLGDIIGSNVELQAPKDSYGWNRWAGGAGWRDAAGKAYKQFLARRLSANKTYAFVGANDGMVHGFDATPSAAGGREVFAYVPGASRELMSALANPRYQHRYLVDGALTLGDVAVQSGGAWNWRSLLVVSTGAGSRSITGLDVGNPSGFGAGSILWELRGSDVGYAGIDELGNVMGKPWIVPIKRDGGTGAPRWVVIFGNGVNSASGRAVLFVVDAVSGEILRRLSVGTFGDAGNGLMHVAPVSIANADGLVDTVYAGDMKGNLWKFDLSQASPSAWKVAHDKPLFTAKNADGQTQPITGAIEVSRSATGGVMTYFGTGSLFVVGDESSRRVQSLYAVVDPAVFTATLTRAALVEQTLSAGGATADGTRLRNISGNDANDRGWYVDLKLEGSNGTGERFIGKPVLQSGKVFFTTFEPTAQACSSGGVNRLYGLMLSNGGAGLAGLTDINKGSNVCTGDCAGIQLKSGGVADKDTAPVKEALVLLPPLADDILDCADGKCSGRTSGEMVGKLSDLLEKKKCWLQLHTPGSAPLSLPRPCGRQSWRQIR